MRILSLLVLVIFLGGCATYKFQRAKAPDNKGYVVSRDDYVILEYTAGKDNQAPERKLAQERFLRRRHMVEHYYKKMGYIENHFKMSIWDPCIMSLKVIGGTFRLPFIAVSDYRYAHNPQYKARIERLQEARDSSEEARIKGLSAQLHGYIESDLAKEGAIK
ncbi:MAG: hypothetical protein PHG40_00765 [Candidatus Omnitrophica bacterium]|nr:hypothetical protein [Candidatus Omnitrophota bacterium]